MKTTLKLFMLFAAMLSLVACNKDKEELRHERDIVYTVNDNTTKVHLSTEAEWQALLDRFCDYAQEGKSVTFRNANTNHDSKFQSRNSSKDAVRISTTSREEIKRWMAQMEAQGKTVTVTYDPATGTWNGTADASASPTDPEPHSDCFSGVLGNASMHAMRAGVITPGLEWTLQIGDTTIWLVTDGNFITADGTSMTLDDITYHIGDSVTFCGERLYIHDYYGNYFYIIILDGTLNYPMPSVKRLPVYIGTKSIFIQEDGAPYPYEYTYTLIMTVDEENHRLYCTSNFLDRTWQGNIGGGVFYYSETGDIDTLDIPVIRVYGNANPGGSLFSLYHHVDGSLHLRDLNHYSDYQTLHTLGPMRLEPTNEYDTWVHEADAGYDIVFHIWNSACVPYHDGFCSEPFYVDCPSPCLAGEFHRTYGNSNASQYEAQFDATGEIRRYTIEWHGDYTLVLTPDDGHESCAESYLFEMNPDCLSATSKRK